MLLVAGRRLGLTPQPAGYASCYSEEAIMLTLFTFALAVGVLFTSVWYACKTED